MIQLKFSSLRSLGALALILSLQGCAWLLPQVPPAEQAVARKQPFVELTQVPFFPQKKYQCGPAALATVLRNLGEPTNPDQLKDQVYLPDRHGSLQIEMLAATRANGFLAYRLKPSLKALLLALNEHTPPVVLMNLSLPIYPMWHYAVVVGFDPKTNNVILRSGEEKRETIELATFLKLWARGNNWAFVALDPAQAPPNFANPEKYLDAASDLEQSHPPRAFAAYLQGTVKWPEDPMLQFALGNAMFNAHHYEGAKNTYLKALKLKPDLADAWNNLAETYWALHNKTQAVDAVRRALAIGGKHHSIYEETAKKFEAQ